jgi:hypothetical protein
MKKNSLFVLFFLTLSLYFPVTASGAGTGSGYIQRVSTTSTGQVFVLTSQRESQAACATEGWAFDMNGTSGPGGKAMLATLLAAQVAGKQVFISGKGNCDVWGDRESVSYVVILS